MRFDGFVALLASLLLLSCEKIPAQKGEATAEIDALALTYGEPNPWLGQCGYDDMVHRYQIDAAGMTSVSKLQNEIEKADGKPVHVKNGDFSGGDFRPVAKSLNYACFEGTNLKETIWLGIESKGIKFHHVDLSDANMRRAQLRQVEFSKVKMIDTDLSNGDLSDGKLIGSQDTDLSFANFSDANLFGFSFACFGEQDSTCTNRSGDPINFQRADLGNADLTALISWGRIDFRDARLRGARINPREVQHLIGAQIDGEVTLIASPQGNAVSLSPSEFESLAKAVEVEWAKRKNADETRVAPFSKGLKVKLAKLRANETADFYEETLPVSDKFMRTELWQRILPVLRDAAWQNATITRDDKGNFEIEGSAKGGGGSVCGLHGNALHYDPKTRQISALTYPEETAREPVRANVFKIRGRVLEMTFPYSWDDRQAMEGFVTCGHRASYSDLVYLD